MNWQNMLEDHLRKFKRYSNDAMGGIYRAENAELAKAEATIIAALIAKMD